MTAHRRAAILVVITAMFSFSAPCLRADVIHLRDGPSITGVLVIEENATEVRYRAKDGATLSVASDRVLLIVHQDPPRAWTLASEALRDRRYAEALTQAETLLADETMKKTWAREYALVLGARAATALGRYADAEAKLGVLFKEQPHSRFLAEARLLAITVARALKKFDVAREWIDAQKAVLVATKRPAVEVDALDISAADVRIDEGKIAAAEEALGDLYLHAAGDPSRRATTWRIKERLVACAVASGDLARAKTIASELESRIDGGGAEARTWLLIAKARIAVGEQKEMADAARALARVRIELRERSLEAAEASFEIGRVHRAISKTDPRAKETAKSYFEEVLARRPETIEAVRAREAIAEK